MTKKSLNSIEMKKSITHLKNLVKNNIHTSYQNIHLNNILTGTYHNAITIKNEKIYRARWNKNGYLFANTQELIYPKKEFSKKGRFNAAGQSIFYAAACELGTIIELRPDINKFFTISSFKLTSNDLPYFFRIGFNENITRKSSSKILMDFITSEITKRASSEEDYNMSILIGSHFLTKPAIVENNKVVHTGLVYPSIESKFISNKTTYNLAMTPDLFHEYYSFDDAVIYVLTKEPSHYQLNPINKGTANKDGNILWTYSFEEMKDRISKGLVYHGEVYKGISSLEDLL